MIENYLTVSDVARVLDLSSESVRQYERTGKLVAIRTVGGVRLFKQTDVEAFKQKLAATRRKTRIRRAGARWQENIKAS